MIYAVAGALLIGLSLGLLGSGGSILTVPVLVYLLHLPDKLAIAESLAIVGGIATVGVVQHAWRGHTQWRYVLWFGVPGMGGAYLGALAARHVPGALQLAVFALVMLAASWVMLKGGPRKAPTPTQAPTQAPIQAPTEAPPGPRARLTGARVLEAVAMGLGVGGMTGFVGVGGGFLIVPALAILARLPMREAVGTSLAIIALNSAAGFLKHSHVLPELGLHPDWARIATFIVIGGLGSVVGGFLASRVPQQKLRRLFAVFLVLMGVFILVREAPKVLSGPSDEPARSNAPARSDAAIGLPRGGVLGVGTLRALREVAPLVDVQRDDLVHQQVRDRRPRQTLLHVVDQLGEHAVQRAQARGVLGQLERARLDPRQRLQRLDHIEHRQLVRRHRESEPAGRPPLRGNDARASQRVQHLGHVPFRDYSRRGNRLAGGVVPLGLGEVDHGSECVFDRSGKHGLEPAPGWVGAKRGNLGLT